MKSEDLPVHDGPVSMITNDAHTLTVDLEEDDGLVPRRVTLSVKGLDSGVKMLPIQALQLADLLREQVQRLKGEW